VSLRRRHGGAHACRELQAALGQGIQVRDWSQEHAAYFRAIRIEKTMMSLILMLVVAVAAFNIVAALVMVVNEKRSTSLSCARSA
jgi:lipoprotein-releasing system permease protein